MSYVFHADLYKVEDALGWYTGKRCATCGTPLVGDLDFNTVKNKCRACIEKRKAARVALKTCERCGKQYRPHHKAQRFCSASCNSKTNRKTCKFRIVCTCGKEFAASNPSAVYCPECKERRSK